MKRYGNLWRQVFSTSNLILSFRKARRGKTLRAPVIEFSKQIRSNLRNLQSQLCSNSWSPSEYRQFFVYEPKERLISAAPFSDRVVHHAIMNILEPILEKFQIYHSYACRKGKGTHACVLQAYANQRRYSFVLKMDIRKFFPSVSHRVLMALLSRHIKDLAIMNCLKKIIFHSGSHDNLSLPIGNLTSQHLANFYLSHLDHFIMQNLRPCSYVRYMDDFVLWFNDKAGMQSAQRQIREYLKSVLKLDLKEQATMAVPSKRGLHFLGFQIMPYSIKLSQQSRLRLKRHICHWNWEYQQGGCEFTLARKADSVLGWNHLAHAHSLLSSIL